MDQRTSSEKAYRAILQAILEGQLPKGEFLSQRMLASIADTSIISVREALKRLEHEHILEAIPKWGVRIPLETRERIQGLYGVREALEVMVAYLLCLQDDPLVAQEILEKATECDLITTEGKESVDYFAQKHRELHLLMAERSGNHHLKLELERLGLRSLLYQSAKSTWANQVDDWRNWHRNLVGEIFSHDPARAQEAMHRHIQHGLHHDLVMFDRGMFV